MWHGFIIDKWFCKSYIQKWIKWNVWIRIVSNLIYDKISMRKEFQYCWFFKIRTTLRDSDWLSDMSVKHQFEWVSGKALLNSIPESMIEIAQKTTFQNSDSFRRYKPWKSFEKVKIHFLQFKVSYLLKEAKIQKMSTNTFDFLMSLQFDPLTQF